MPQPRTGRAANAANEPDQTARRIAPLPSRSGSIGRFQAGAVDAFGAMREKIDGRKRIAGASNAASAAPIQIGRGASSGHGASNTASASKATASPIHAPRE